MGGLEFSRVRWTGSSESKQFRGVAYFASDDKRLLITFIEAPAEGHDEALRLAESAVLTLRKK